MRESFAGLVLCEVNDSEGSEKAAASALDADGEDAGAYCRAGGVVGDCTGTEPTT